MTVTIQKKKKKLSRPEKNSEPHVPPVYRSPLPDEWAGQTDEGFFFHIYRTAG